jgi:hypothetical protein
MNTDFEQRLKSEMEQVAVRPRPGLAREAYRRYRTRRRTARAVAVTSTAAVAAAGTAVGLTGAPGASVTPAETTAYVVGRVSSALSGSGEIAGSYTHTTVDGTPSRPILDGRTWTYGNQRRTLSLTPGGQPSIAWAVAKTSNGYVHQLGVNYQARTYTRQSWKSMVPTTAPSDICATSRYQLVGDQFLTSDPKAGIEDGLRCGVFTLAGHQRIDGIDALKLVNQEPRSGGTPWMTLTLWVDPATYLPIETQLDPHGHLPLGGIVRNGKGGIVRVATIRYITATFTWLPPTRANLALLSPPIPAGFRQVSEEP